MLDLKKLEEQLDAELANETEESLTAWIHQKRLQSFLQCLGEGDIEALPNEPPVVLFASADSIPPEASILMASDGTKYLNAA